MVAELRLEMAWSPSYKASKLESPGRAGPVSVFIPGRALASGPVPCNIRAGPGRAGSCLEAARAGRGRFFEDVQGTYKLTYGTYKSLMPSQQTVLYPGKRDSIPANVPAILANVPLSRQTCPHPGSLCQRTKNLHAQWKSQQVMPS